MLLLCLLVCESCVAKKDQGRRPRGVAQKNVLYSRRAGDRSAVAGDVLVFGARLRLRTRRADVEMMFVVLPGRHDETATSRLLLCPPTRRPGQDGCRILPNFTLQALVAS